MRGHTDRLQALFDVGGASCLRPLCDLLVEEVGAGAPLLCGAQISAVSQVAAAHGFSEPPPLCVVACRDRYEAFFAVLGLAWVDAVGANTSSRLPRRCATVPSNP